MSITSHPETIEPRIALAGFQYFAIVFAVGFVLGILLVLLLEPWLGSRWAELLEMLFMFLATLCFLETLNVLISQCVERAAKEAVRFDSREAPTCIS